jgi:inorganic triphosphatase YgiF
MGVSASAFQLMPEAAKEIEIKLCAPPEVVRRLSRQRELRGAARAVMRRLHAVYFDTPEADLWQRGIALRVRREGASATRHLAGARWLQTVKGGGSARGGLHERFEFESEVAGPAPELDRIPHAPLTAIFAAPELAARLKPVFVTTFTRSSRVIAPAPDVAIEVSIDRGRIRAGDRGEAVSEVELELKAGATGDLIAYARKLVAAAPLRLENRSKAERGYALSRRERYAPVKARANVLAPDTGVAAAFKSILAAALAQLQANERGLLEGRDPEFLHQMRVAVRRMRSVVAVCDATLPAAIGGALATELRWLAHALGPARDWDVFLAETLEPVHREFPRHAGFAELMRYCRNARGAAWRQARRAVNSARYRQLILDVVGVIADDAWLKQLDAKQLATASALATRFAAGVLAERYARVRRRGRNLEKLSAAQLHRLRIAIKKLRYAADAFASLFAPAATVPLLKRLSDLQDILGVINDTATAARLIDGCSGGRQSRTLAEARGIVRGWGHGRAELQRSELAGAWKAFRAAKNFW